MGGGVRCWATREVATESAWTGFAPSCARPTGGSRKRTSPARCSPRRELTGPRELADWAVGASKGEIALLSVTVARVSKTGDVVAARVVHRALGAVREHLEAVLGRTGRWVGRPPVAFVGGLVRVGGVLREVVVEVAGEVGYEVRLEEVVPERGALGRAVGLGGD